MWRRQLSLKLSASIALDTFNSVDMPSANGVRWMCVFVCVRCMPTKHPEEINCEMAIKTDFYVLSESLFAGAEINSDITCHITETDSLMARIHCVLYMTVCASRAEMYFFCSSNGSLMMSCRFSMFSRQHSFDAIRCRFACLHVSMRVCVCVCVQEQSVWHIIIEEVMRQWGGNYNWAMHHIYISWFIRFNAYRSVNGAKKVVWCCCCCCCRSPFPSPFVYSESQRFNCLAAVSKSLRGFPEIAHHHFAKRSARFCFVRIATFPVVNLIEFVSLLLFFCSFFFFLATQMSIEM